MTNSNVHTIKQCGGHSAVVYTAARLIQLKAENFGYV